MTNASTGTTQSTATQNHVGSQIGQDEANSNVTAQRTEDTKSEGTQAGGTLQQTSTKTTSTGTGTRTKDFNDDMVRKTISHSTYHFLYSNLF